MLEDDTKPESQPLSKQELDEVTAFVKRMKRAAQQILDARGGVPVPDGVTVATMDAEGNLLWVPGAPFPERESGYW